MLIEHQHQHQPGVFDPGHCRDCARASDLLDHYHHVQPGTDPQAGPPVGPAGRHAIWALWSSGAGILFGVVALLAG
jgi:hypothetical protein